MDGGSDRLDEPLIPGMKLGNEVSQLLLWFHFPKKAAGSFLPAAAKGKGIKPRSCYWTLKNFLSAVGVIR